MNYTISEREGLDWMGRPILRYVIIQDGVTYMGESTVRAEAEQWLERRRETDEAVAAAEWVAFGA